MFKGFTASMLSDCITVIDRSNINKIMITTANVQLAY